MRAKLSQRAAVRCSRIAIAGPAIMVKEQNGNIRPPQTFTLWGKRQQSTER
jgi:hypothetical protein